MIASKSTGWVAGKACSLNPFVLLRKPGSCNSTAPRTRHNGNDGWERGRRVRASGAMPSEEPDDVQPASASPASNAAEAESPVSQFEQQLGVLSRQLTNLFPLWILLAAAIALQHPPAFTWFTPHITNGLAFVMLGTGLTLTLSDMGNVFTKMPQLLLLGMALQYTVLPCLGFLISRGWGLETGLAAGVALVSCCPGGSASNIVAYIAGGEMALSILMTTASTLAAIITLPLLTSMLLGTMVSVDPLAMLQSTVQVVLVPTFLGALLNQSFPRAVQRASKFTPILATAVVALIIGSTLGQNVVAAKTAGWKLVSAVFVLHSAGFTIGYGVSKALGLSEKICRTNSIEVGMQNSALGAVLASIHFAADPTVAAPCAISACTHATLGSLLAGYWRARPVDDTAK